MRVSCFYERFARCGRHPMPFGFCRLGLFVQFQQRRLIFFMEEIGAQDIRDRSNIQ
jgi:hypothetical protein